MLDPVAKTVTVFGSALGANAYEGNVIAPNGNVYGTPRTAANILIIDRQGPTQTTGAVSPGLGFAGTLAGDGNIYLIPRLPAVFGVINPNSRGSLCASIVLSPYFNKY